MKISVVIPVYNASKWLADCLDSAAAIDYHNMEVILVDDGSTDDSPEICDRYANRYGWQVIHSANGGLSAARNKGVDAASGDYVAFIDSDDVVHPQYLTTMATALVSSGARASMCVATQKGIDKLKVSRKVKVLDTRQAIERTLYQHSLTPSMCGKLFPREVLAAVRQHEDRWYEDLDAFYRIYESLDGKIACSDAILYYYRPNPESFINTFSPGRLDVLRVTADIERHYANDPKLKRAARDRRFSANYNMYLLCRKFGQKEQAADCLKLIKKYRREILLNPKVRLKNRLGALLAYFLPSPK